jgi:tRNA(Ile)-lysidine synthase TilS/MesJ
MAELSELTVPWWTDGGGEEPVRLTLWRPLLREPRAAVRSYASTLGLEWIEDPSNDDRGPRRNALRHDALPMLERISPGATAALARYGRTAAEEDAALEALAAALADRAGTADGGLRLAVLAAEAPVLRRRAVRRWLLARTGYRGTTADRTEAVLGLLAPGEGGRRVEVGAGWTVLVRGGELRAARIGEDADGGKAGP